MGKWIIFRDLTLFYSNPKAASQHPGARRQTLCARGNYTKYTLEQEPCCGNIWPDLTIVVIITLQQQEEEEEEEGGELLQQFRSVIHCSGLLSALQPRLLWSIHRSATLGEWPSV